MTWKGSRGEWAGQCPGGALLALIVLVLQASCATGGAFRSEPPRTRYAQSMNSAVDGCVRTPGCVAAAPGEEAVIPWASRVVETVRTVVTVKEFLDDMALRRIEKILVECAQEADSQVNEREYGPGRYPDDAECSRMVRNKDGEKVSRAIELGEMKHEVAFACVRRRLFTDYPDNISIEPQYGWDETLQKYVLTRIWKDSLKPDIVLHFARDPSQVQCVFDFKFPCVAAKKGRPLGPDELAQLAKYDKLRGTCPSAIVTPQLGINP